MLASAPASFRIIQCMQRVSYGVLSRPQRFDLQLQTAQLVCVVTALPGA